MTLLIMVLIIVNIFSHKQLTDQPLIKAIVIILCVYRTCFLAKYIILSYNILVPQQAAIHSEQYLMTLISQFHLFQVVIHAKTYLFLELETLPVGRMDVDKLGEI